MTLWGPNGEILDYASKQWSGLFKSYFLPRWELFFEVLEECLRSGKTFDGAAFRKQFIRQIGIPFTKSREDFPDKTKGDAVKQALKLYMKWRGEAGLKDANTNDIN